MSVLRVYLPRECDEAGVPLDWWSCRRCADRPGVIWMKDGTGDEYPCPDCEGHGSLRAAAMAAVEPRGWSSADHINYQRGDEVPARCEDCGHPMSEGTWEAWNLEAARPHVGKVERYALAALRTMPAVDPGFNGWWNATHYSPCDEGCRHGGVVATYERPTAPIREARFLSATGESIVRREASWRGVDVRCLSWPHDLRPEQLAVLCLRCWAAR